MAEAQSDFASRAYQIDLYEQVIQGNSIIYLPTGSGKTYIAVMVINRLSSDVNKPYLEGGKRIIFAVNTVALAEQQCKYLSRHTHLTCASYTGDMKVDFWDRAQWTNELIKNEVLVMTSQIFLNMLTHGYISLDRLALLIFDECHRGVSDHPMRLIMQRFQNCPPENQPRVLGLTATLINSNIKAAKISDTIEELETTFHAKIIAATSLVHVRPYATNPRESSVVYHPLPRNQVISEAVMLLEEAREVVQKIDGDIAFNTISLSDSVFRPASKINQLQTIINGLQEHIELTGVYGGSVAALLQIIRLEYMNRSSNHQEVVYVLEYLITVFTKVRRVLEDSMEGYSATDKIFKFSSLRVVKLCGILYDFNKDKLADQRFCSLIFVRTRFTAKVLYHILKTVHTVDERFQFLKPEFMVGYTNNPLDNSREALCQRRWNNEVLHKFKTGRANCIIATDVIEEGVDVPDCTLVVRYDLPQDFRSYIQSKGRARHSTSKYVLLRSSDDHSFPTKYSNYQRIEKILEMYLIGKTDLRSEPTADDVAEKMYTSEIEPYRVTNVLGDTSVVTATSAIDLVNRYCSSLAKSHFISLTPVWKLDKMKDSLNKDEALYKVILRLPTLSLLKDPVVGDAMPSIKLAKRSAALNCCKKLHLLKELNDNLLPAGSEIILESLEHLFPNWRREEQSPISLLGTKSKKRQHELVHAECLYAAFPQPGADSYLHVIEMIPAYSVPHDNRRIVFYHLLADRGGFALLSSKKLPELSSFPIFMNVGNLDVDIHVNHAKLRFTEEEIEQLRIFHTFIFKRIVTVIKSFMVFDKDNWDNSFLVVPVDHNWNINWEIVLKFQNVIDELAAIKPKKPIHVSASEYELALVQPSYRSSSVYVVTQICEDRVANSSFPTPDFNSYTHYFEDRHGIVIEEGNQPLLEVKPISSKINCIKPRATNTSLSKRKRADLLEDLEEHLVPELCNKYDFPALYWLKATTLPSVIHRIQQFLIAEQLRVTIQQETKLGQPKLSSGESWRKLKISSTDISSETVEEPANLSMDETLSEHSENPELLGPEFDVLEMESTMYGWSKDEEPQDIERNILDIQYIDISNFRSFMNGKSEPNNMLQYPQKNVGYAKKPVVSIPDIKILSKKETQGPHQTDIMEALTSKMAHDILNLELLETLGDSFLKFFTSLFLIETFPQFSEGHLTSVKGKLVGNRNLYYCGYNKRIPGMIKVDEFEPMANFIPPAYSVQRKLQQILIQAEVSPNILYNFKISVPEQVKGFLSEATFLEIREQILGWEGVDSQSGLEHFLGLQTVSDKAVADSVEALIGVYLNTMSIESAARILQWFQIIPDEASIPRLLTETMNSPRIGPGDVNIHMPWANALEQRLGYKFKDRAYLLQAFTHPSFSANMITASYQRLEFLGDAILDFLITTFIYENVDNLTPGQVTDLRSALVNNITFACLAVRYGLHTHLLAYAPAVHDLIDRFVNAQVQRNHIVDSELLWVLLEEPEHSMAEYINVPKVLGDIFESLAGAIYLDSNKDLSQVWKIYYALMHHEIAEFSSNIPKQPIRVLHETQGTNPKFYKVKPTASGTAIMIGLEVTIAGKRKIIHGFGSNKKEAKCAAAKQALTELRCK